MKKREIIAATLEYIKVMAANYQTATPLKLKLAEIKPEEVLASMKLKK